MTMQEIQQELKKATSDIKTHIDERQAAGLKLQNEEIGKISQDIVRIQEKQQVSARAQLAAAYEGDKDNVIQAGRYAGLDPWDLRLMQSLCASESGRDGLDATQQGNLTLWKANLDKAGLEFAAALDSISTGAGDELVPTAEARRLWMDVNLTTPLLGQMQRVNMPTDPFDIPLQLGDINFYPGTQNVAATSTAPTTAKQTLTSFEEVGHVPWSYDLSEDAVIAMLPELRSSLVRNVSEVLEDIILNADTSVTNGINSDGATISKTDAGKAQWLHGFNGLLHAALVDNTAMANNHAAVPSADMFNEARRNMGKYGMNNRRANTSVVHVMDIVTWIHSQAISTIQTLDKYGPQATILTGELASIEGIPILVSAKIREADTDGKITDAGNVSDVGRLLTVNLAMWRYGYRRQMMIETQRDIVKRQHDMVVSFRLALNEQTASKSTQTHTHVQFNITRS